MPKFLSALRRAWSVAVALVLIGVAVGAAVAVIQRPSYTAQAQSFLSSVGANSLTDLSQGNTFTQNILKSYTDVATAPIVLDPVRSKLSLQMSVDQLAQEIEVSSSLDTVIISIQVTDASATRAAKIANAVNGQLASTARTLSTTDNGKSSASIKLTAIHPASVPTQVASPRPLVYIGMGGLLGLIVGGLVIAVCAFFDTRVRTLGDLNDATRLRLIGAVSFDRKIAKNRSVLKHENDNQSAREIQVIAAKLLSIPFEGEPILAFTSALPSAGKSVITGRLAIALSQLGRSVVVVDANFREPTQCQLFEVGRSAGLSDYLRGAADLAEIVVDLDMFPMVSIVPAGSARDSAAMVGRSGELAGLLSKLCITYDMVLVDSAPVVGIPDMVGLVNALPNVVLVESIGGVTRRQLRLAMQDVRFVRANLLGVVANKVNWTFERSVGQDVDQ